ncbi:MAG: type IV pilus assembly protein PilM [Planctomycetales bacterium]|nr:type IV pilus assembly protein PilM [Planctomycetales bacterium]
MAEPRSAWGIDIGQAGLKAVKVRYADAAQQAVAVAFDYIPHPKILSQPDANPEELIAQALSTFLSRNDLHGDLVAISVPGQTALARFIQLPPVEESKVYEIVKYEARQQIPFALEDVIWDFQRLGAGLAEGGFVLDAEVGLFAMKREQVLQHLAPYTKSKVEIELIQIAPLALYNFYCYDLLGANFSDDDAGSDYYIILDMGADNSTLVVTNGKKIWIRNVPLGGNHFTRALTKEMKLTFAKAEHLKCNATKSPDPKAIFQALRPVFNDYVAEIQRSIGYFSSVNREAKITKILGVGNGFKLAGLQKFLQQNLQYEVERLESFSALVGDTVLNAPLFQDNILAFAVPYGLALQALNRGRIHTTLLPPEIKLARTIRRKKPWAVATAASLLFALATSALGYGHVMGTVHETVFGDAEKRAGEVNSKKSSMKTEYDGVAAKYALVRKDGDQVLSSPGERDHWLEVYKAINECLPRDVGDQMDEDDPTKKNRIRIYSITAKYYPDLTKWHASLSDMGKQGISDLGIAAPGVATAQGTVAGTAAAVQPAPSSPASGAAGMPAGAGYVFTLKGRHFHQEVDQQGKRVTEMSGIRYVRNTLIENLKQWTVQQQGSPEPVPVRQLGISHPVVVSSPKEIVVTYHPKRKPGSIKTGGTGVSTGFGSRPPGSAVPGNNPTGAAVKTPMPKPGGKTAPGAAKETTEPEGDGSIQIPQTDFVLEFVWKETDRGTRPVVPAGTPQPATQPGAVAGGIPATGVPVGTGIPAGGAVAEAAPPLSNPPTGVAPAQPAAAPTAPPGTPLKP